MFHAVVRSDLPLTLHSALFTVSLIFYFILLIFVFILIFQWMLPEQDPLCTSPNEESGPLANNASLTGYEPNFIDDYHFSETTEIFHPGVLQRHDAVVPARHGDQ